MQPNGWHVLSQNYNERLMPDGAFHDVVEVTIQADDGATTKLVVPYPQYRPDVVIALGNDWYEKHVAVSAIGNG
jgi:hypothetical protein